AFTDGGPVQLRGDEHADGHADDAPDHGCDRELAHHLVVVIAGPRGLTVAGSGRGRNGWGRGHGEMTLVCVYGFSGPAPRPGLITIKSGVAARRRPPGRGGAWPIAAGGEKEGMLQRTL